MRSLLYSDWCTLKGAAKGYLLLVATFPLIAVMGNVAEAAPDATALATNVHSTIVSTCVTMLAFYGCLTFFGNDEREGWEGVRLSLPITRSLVVRSRYATQLLWVVMLEVLANLTGMCVRAAAAMVLHGQPGLVPVGEAVLLSGLVLVVCILYLAIEMPLLFKTGLSRARVYFMLPFLACTLLVIEPVREVVREVVRTVAGTVSSVVGALGSPLPLMAGALVVALAVYGASMLLSERIYESRDF